MLHFCCFADEEGSRGRVVGKRREKEGGKSEGAPSAKKPSLATDKKEVNVADSSNTEQEAPPTATPAAMVKADSIEQTLICQICQVH